MHIVFPWRDEDSKVYHRLKEECRVLGAYYPATPQFLMTRALQGLLKRESLTKCAFHTYDAMLPDLHPRHDPELIMIFLYELMGVLYKELGIAIRTLSRRKADKIRVKWVREDAYLVSVP